MIHFEAVILPSVVLLLCTTTIVLLYVFFPLFHGRCSLPMFRTYRRAVMFWYAIIIASIVSFFPRLPALLFSSDEFSFSLPPFLYLGVLVFQRFRWALDSACDAFKLILRYRDLTLSTLGVPLIAPVGPISSIRGFHVADHWRHIDRPYISHVAYYGI